MPRVLVPAEKAGWYVDAAEPEGKKVRKQDGDQIFDNILDAQQALDVLEKAHGPQGTGASANGSAPAQTLAETGKTLTGTTATIRCSWIEGGKNDGRPYETIKLASGRTIKGLSAAEQKKACGKKRTVKTQDLFQARYCVDHQEANRKRLRSERQKRKRQAAKATA